VTRQRVGRGRSAGGSAPNLPRPPASIRHATYLLIADGLTTALTHAEELTCCPVEGEFNLHTGTTVIRYSHEADTCTRRIQRGHINQNSGGICRITCYLNDVVAMAFLDDGSVERHLGYSKKARLRMRPEAGKAWSG